MSKIEIDQCAGSARQLIDISTTLCRETLASSSSPAFTSSRVLALERRDHCNVSFIWIGSHCGTHINAPAHISTLGEPIDRMPLDATVGPARIVAFMKSGPIREEDLAAWNVQPGERLLIRTHGSGRPAPFLAWRAARGLAAKRIRAVGIDRPSIGDESDADMLTHRTLLAGDVWVIEGLDLSRVDVGRYELMCLPLKFEGGDAAPARAVLRPL